MRKDSLGNRMKENYEDRSRYKLIRRMPVIIRLDGKAFHTFTKGCEKPFDDNLSKAMECTTKALCEYIQGAKVGYQQSDEISILLTDFDTLTTDAWFDYNIQKICSISAAYCSYIFNYFYDTGTSGTNFALFDARCFNIPKEEVNNYFVWRQQDWVRNSLQMLSRAYFSHKELHKKNSKDMHEMLYTKNINWADLDDKWKNGVTMYRQDRNFIIDTSNIFTRTKLTDIFMEY